MSLHHWYRRGRVDSPHLNPLTAQGSHNLLPHILNVQLNFNATCNLFFLVYSHSSFSPKLCYHPWLFSSFLCLRLNQHILSFTAKIHPDSSYFCFTTDITLVTSPSPLIHFIIIASHCFSWSYTCFSQVCINTTYRMSLLNMSDQVLF